MYNQSEDMREEGIAEDWLENYAKDWLEGYAIGWLKGYEIGRTRAHISSLRNLMEALNLSAEQAMAILKIPTAERPKMMKLLEQ